MDGTKTPKKCCFFKFIAKNCWNNCNFVITILGVSTYNYLAHSRRSNCDELHCRRCTMEQSAATVTVSNRTTSYVIRLIFGILDGSSLFCIVSLESHCSKNISVRIKQIIDRARKATPALFYLMRSSICDSWSTATRDRYLESCEFNINIFDVCALCLWLIILSKDW